MTQIDIPNECYLTAAKHLDKFGENFTTEGFMSVDWAIKTGRSLDGYIEPKLLAGNSSQDFYIEKYTPLEVERTEFANVRVEVSKNRIGVHVPASSLGDISNPDKYLPEDTSCLKINSLKVTAD